MSGEAQQQVESVRQLIAARRYAEAESACAQIIGDYPDEADALNLLGVIELMTNRVDQAIAHLSQAIAMRPAADYYNNLGEALHRKGAHDNAIAAFEQAVALRPDYVAALSNLAKVHLARGDAPAAVDAATRATQHAPDSFKAFHRLGQALRANKQALQAIEAFSRAVSINAAYYPALTDLGEALLATQQFDASAAAYAKAADLRPTDVAAVFNYGAALEMQGRITDALRCYERAQQLHPRDSTRLLMATRVPMIYESRDDLLAWRRRIEENLAALRRENVRVDAERAPVASVFLLAYQGLNDRDILRDYASHIVAPYLPSPAKSRTSDGRIHVGFVSSFFRRHTIGRINQGLIAQLDRAKVHVTVLSLGRHDDDVARFIRGHCDAFVEVPRRLPEARQVIVDQQLDVLVYTDLAMDNVTNTLAFSRLAPIQCATWGHPSTSGISTIDYYISSELLESESAQDHYTEKLIRLPNLSVYYYRPTLTQPRGRELMGFDDGVHVYGCLQNLFKLHPDYDAILDDILRRDSRGIVLLPHANSAEWDAALMKRLNGSMPRTVDRVRFMDPLPYEQYLNLSAACDVLLAPIHFGAGNTSYEAFAFGTPTVTMPSEFLKGRITYGLYRAMGVMDCVASTPAEYADIAVGLGTDRDWRASVREKILAANDVLYENPAGVRDFESFIERAFSGPLPP